MADDKNSAGGPPDWNALNQQFWKAWTEGAGQAGAARRGDLPWHEGLEMWSRMFAGQGGGQAEVVERMLAGARQFAAFAQSATQPDGAAFGAAGQNPWSAAYAQSFGPLSATHNPMLEAMRSVAGQGAKGFEQFAAEAGRLAAPMREEFAAMTSMPAFGYTREQQERSQAFVAASVALQERMSRYNALMLKASMRAFELMEGKLGERSEPGREVGTLRGLYDLWIDAAEEGYAEVALSQEFREAYGELVNAQMRLKKLVNEEIERSTEGVGIPTRTEVDAVHRRLAELRRRLARLEDALGTEVLPAADESSNAAAPRAAKRRAAKPRKPSKVARPARAAEAAPAKTRPSAQAPRAPARAGFAETLAATRARRARTTQPRRK